MRNYKEIPLLRKVANIGMRFLWQIAARMPGKDVQHGQKMFKAKYGKQLLQELDEKGGYQIELDLMLSFYKQKACFGEVGVSTEYKNYSGKSGMGFKNLKWIKQITHALKIALNKS